VGKLVGLSLTGGWSMGAWRAAVCGVRSIGGGAEVARRCRGDGVTALRPSVRTTPLRRSIRATSTAAERGQVPEREAPGLSKKFWRVRPQGELQRSRNRQKLLRADPAT
jgi:hypothetical protein